MSEPYLGEVRIVGFNFAPRGWALCDGQLLPINQNQSLYSVLGTTYGGNGRTDFALPDLRGRAPMHAGAGVAGAHTVNLGNRGGEQRVALSVAEMPAHRHSALASTEPAIETDPADAVLAKRPRFAPDLYAEANNLTALESGAVTTTGGGQDHQNQQPYLAVNFVIALVGLFPPRS